MPIIGIASSGGMKPTTPVIGTATDGGTGTTVSVAFTPSTYIGKGTITYTAISSPGGFTGTSSGSPITVSGLTSGTAYTFTVYGTTNYGVVSGTSAASNSVTPAAPADFFSIATATSTGSTTTLSFTSIPQTYKDLQIRFYAQGTGSGGGQPYVIRFNSDTGSTYYTRYVSSSGAVDKTTGAYGLSTFMYVSYNGNRLNYPNGGIVDIGNYTNTTYVKPVKTLVYGADATGANSDLSLMGGYWNNNSAITRIDIIIATGTAFNSNTVAALYGIKG